MPRFVGASPTQCLALFRQCIAKVDAGDMAAYNILKNVVADAGEGVVFRERNVQQGRTSSKRGSDTPVVSDGNNSVDNKYNPRTTKGMSDCDWESGVSFFSEITWQWLG